MSGLTDASKSLLLSQIRQVSANFNETAFKQLMKKFLILQQTVHFSELEDWLKQLDKEDVHLSHGILAVLYFSVADYDNSAFEAVVVEEYFPDTNLWKNLSVNAIILGAFEIKP